MIPNLQTFISWFLAFQSVAPAIAITVAAALLIACIVGATRSPDQEHDAFFHRHVC